MEVLKSKFIEFAAKLALMLNCLKKQRDPDLKLQIVMPESLYQTCQPQQIQTLNTSVLLSSRSNTTSLTNKPTESPKDLSDVNGKPLVKSDNFKKYSASFFAGYKSLKKGLTKQYYSVVGLPKIRVVCIGKTGSGKTTLINCLMNQIQQKEYEDERIIAITQQINLKNPKNGDEVPLQYKCNLP